MGQGQQDQETEARRLARVAAWSAANEPEKALALSARAAALAPHMWECHAHRGNIIERLGHQDDALAAYRNALQCAPKNPFARDQLAECYRKHGDYARALETWYGGLNPPSMDFIWLKALFWRRAAVEGPAPASAIESPPGALRPLVEFVRGLPPDCFWDPSGFTPVGELHPHLLSRQEVFWLRLLEALRTGREVEALWLLTFQGFDRASWRPSLERALTRILFYRRSGFFGTVAGSGQEILLTDEPQHPFLTELFRCSERPGTPIEDTMKKLLISDWVYVAACSSAGWTAAAQRLKPAGDLPREMPAWLRQALQPIAGS